MAWLKLCDGDPLVKTLSEVFHANIIRVPEERLQPLSTLAAKGDKLVYRGTLADLLAGVPPPEIASPSLLTGAMADVQGKRSRKVDANLGLEIMRGFLRGFAGAASLGVAEHFSGALEVSFSFNEVSRVYVDPARVGKLLAGRKLDLQNGVVASFLSDDPWDCLVIDSIVTSRDFTIRVERQSGSEFRLDIPAIESLLSKANAKVSVSNTSSKALTFKGPKALAFAFTCQPLILDQNGVIQQLPPDSERRAFERDGSPAKYLISQRPAMLDWIEA